jgi:hypothetical protein
VNPAPPATELDPHDRRLILACLTLTADERLLRLAQAHEFRALIREARPYELRER